MGMGTLYAVAPVKVLGMLLRQTGAVSGTSRHPAAPRVEESPSTALSLCAVLAGHGPPGCWGWGPVPQGGGGSISPVEKKQECFCAFWCPPCCRLVPKGALGFSLLLQARGARRHPRAPTRPCRELQERNKQTKKSLYDSNPNFSLHCCSKQA